MVSPQHFQQQVAYAAWSAECIARLGLSNPWGIIHSEFESDALKLGRLQARRLHLRFQDGTLIDTDNADVLPPALMLEGEHQETVVVLALPLIRANGGNCLKPDEVAQRPVRYRQRWQDVRNQYGDDTRQIAVLQPELSLRFAHQNNSDYLTCPVARLVQDSQGVWVLDETFLPPLLTIGSSHWLMRQLEQLMTQLRARLIRLMGMRRESNERMADFAVADVSLFWLLNALNSAEPVLGQYVRFPQSPVTDITYIRTHEGWLYLAVVVDLFSRKIIGWSMQSRMTKDIVLNALLMAVWRRNPQKQVLVHSDQGSQYTSHEWQSFLKSHSLEGSMSRRGNCHDNAVAESFFQLLKRERIKKKIYGTREEARSDIFDYIEMFYNSKRRHGSSDQMSPTEYENQYYQRLGSV